MQRNDLEDTTLQCVRCRAWNYPFASFCISCGQPFDGEWGDSDPASAQSAGIEPYKGSDEHPPSPLGLNTAIHRFRWEAAIGLLILLLTLGYALYNVQRTNAQTDAYREGIAAAQHKDWDRAADLFSHAGDHPDANNQRQQAQKQVAERNRLYTEGTQAANHQDWPASLSALQAVQAIQPNYLDTAGLLAKAKQGTFNHDLVSIAYLVSDGPTAPGIYVRDGQGGPSRLDRSDKDSRIRAVSPDGKALVYDRTSNESDYLPSLRHNTVVGDTFAHFTRERILVLALRGSDNTITTVTLPQLDINGTGVFSKDGLWWFSKQVGLGSYVDQVFYVNNFPPLKLRVEQISGTMGDREVVAVDPPRSRVVMAELAYGSSGYWQTNLYLADAGGKHERKLQTVAGRVSEASVSADGRWLLCTTQENTANALKSIWALPLGGQAEPRLLDMLVWSGLDTSAQMSAFLAPSDSHAKVLISRTGAGTGKVSKLAIYDLDDGGISTFNLNNYYGRPYTLAESNFSRDGQYLTVQRGSDSGVGLALMSPGAPRSQFRWGVNLPVSRSERVEAQFSPRDDYVIANVQESDSILQASAQTLYTVPVSVTGTFSEPKLIVTASSANDKTTPTVAICSGGSLLAYIDVKKELHAVSYDGSNDTLIAPNVEAVWSLGSIP